jgi:Circadian oscillating protein COP23
MLFPQNFLPPSLSLGLSLGLVASGLLLSPGSASAQSVATTTVPTTDVVIPTDGSPVPSRPSGSPIATPLPSTGNVPLSAVRFSCQASNGRYSVMYQPESQPSKYFAWAVPQQMGGGWTPEKRCREISARLELYRPDGLVEMQTGTENGYNTVCVTTDNVPGCRIVFTVPKGQDPVATRDGVFSNLAIADSGQQTAGVYTYQDNSGKALLNQIGGALKVDLGGLLGTQANPVAAPARTGIALKPFLDRADGGSGAQLQSGGTTIVKAPAAVAKPVAAPSKGRRLRNLFR